MLLDAIMDLDHVTKIAQIAFYAVGGSIAVLTYLKAKNGLLNTINTEFHKRVLDRLAALSDELFDEFDSASKNHWSNDDVAGEIVSSIHEVLDPVKGKLSENEVLADYAPGIPIPTQHSRLVAYLTRVKSDPFVPPAIRDKVVRYLAGRADALMNAVMIEGERYIAGLSEGKYWDTVDTNKHWMHNNIIDHLYRDGYNISQNEQAVVEIREAIRTYFESYNPIKVSK